MTDPDVKIRALDAAYKPFPAFSEWASRTSVDAVRWDRYNASLQNRARSSPGALDRARQVAKRAAALDTGAIEGLYAVDRGFTFTVAFETAAWETALAQKGERVRPLFESQLRAYDYVLDLATNAQPIAEAAIRKLHEVVCEAQLTYRVMTSVGPQEQPLPKGQYKVLPNHVRTRKGMDHAYAPVDMTPPEMARFVDELRSEAFLLAHPVQQASYAHHALVVIHPFADGNGRVARALASAFTYRAVSMPILILSEQKNVYLDSLEAADNGDYQAFVDFILGRSLDTIQLVSDSFGAAVGPSAEESASAIDALYRTRGGYTHEQVDEAGMRLAETFALEIRQAIARRANTRISAEVNLVRGATPGAPDTAHRAPEGGLTLNISARTTPPAQAALSRDYHVWVPRDATGDDDVILTGPFPNPAGRGVETISARMDQLSPAVSGILQIRAGVIANRLVDEALAELKQGAERALRGRK